MIHVTKDEAILLRRLYPEYKIRRTMVQDSKRHHYYAPSVEVLLRAIADTNYEAAELVAWIDIERGRRKRRHNKQRDVK